MESDYSLWQERFKHNESVLFVEHDFRRPIDEGFYRPEFISLGPLNYKGKSSIQINPHYFGQVQQAKKSDETRFLVVGGLVKERKDVSSLWRSIEELLSQGIKGFSIDIVGRNSKVQVPSGLESVTNVVGEVSFEELYHHVESSHFILPLLCPYKHERYMTTGSSGQVQLIYGFQIPAVIHEDFARHYELDCGASVAYRSSDGLAESMKVAISMSPTQYGDMRSLVAERADAIYTRSLSNMSQMLSRE